MIIKVHNFEINLLIKVPDKKCLPFPIPKSRIIHIKNNIMIKPIGVFFASLRI